MSGQHQKAYEYFTKTLELKKDNPKAVHGLMLSAFNIGKFDEALQRCDEYERITGTDMQGERTEIMQHMQ
jgi:Tfp pilus assembly protein PilF